MGSTVLPYGVGFLLQFGDHHDRIILLAESGGLLSRYVAHEPLAIHRRKTHCASALEIVGYQIRLLIQYAFMRALVVNEKVWLAIKCIGMKQEMRR